MTLSRPEPTLTGGDFQCRHCRLLAGSSPSLPDGSNPSAAIVQSASDVQCSRLLKTTSSVFCLGRSHSVKQRSHKTGFSKRTPSLYFPARKPRLAQGAWSSRRGIWIFVWKTPLSHLTFHVDKFLTRVNIASYRNTTHHQQGKST